MRVVGRDSVRAGFQKQVFKTWQVLKTCKTCFPCKNPCKSPYFDCQNTRYFRYFQNTVIFTKNFSKTDFEIATSFCRQKNCKLWNLRLWNTDFSIVKIVIFGPKTEPFEKKTLSYLVISACSFQPFEPNFFLCDRGVHSNTLPKFLDHYIYTRNRFLYKNVWQ